MRGEILDGWLGDDGDGEQKKVELDLLALPKRVISLALGGGETIRLQVSAEAHDALSGGGEDTTLLLGWPEPVVVIRQRGVVVRAEGDILHFGDLVLDEVRTLRRVGYDYVDAESAAIRVHLELEERAAIDPSRAFRRLGFTGGQRERSHGATAAGPLRDQAVLDAGSQTRFGPYLLHHTGSFEHQRRPIQGRVGHGYDFRLERVADERPAGLADDGLDPFRGPEPVAIVQAARARGELDAEEILAGEPALSRWLLAFEGARGALEQAMRETAPMAPQPWRMGESLEIHTARLSRAPNGAAIVGRAVITLHPLGALKVARTSELTLAGRLRRP
jgi:hypothetical protein